MANRIYLYSSNDKPGKKKIKFKGIGEHPYNPPFDFEIMAHKVKGIGESIIWDKDNNGEIIKNIYSDYSTGYGYLMKFYLQLIKLYADEDEIQDKVKESLTFLNKNKGRYLITEYAEIAAMSDDNLNKEIVAYAKNISKNTIKKLSTFLKLENKNQLDSWCKKNSIYHDFETFYEEGLAVNYPDESWSNVLYYG